MRYNFIHRLTKYVLFCSAFVCTLEGFILQPFNLLPLRCSSQGVTVSLNATSGMFTSYELSENINDPSVEHGSGYNQGEDEIGYDKSEAPEVYASEYSEEGHYEGNDPELTEDQIEYGEEPGEDDEVLDLEINEPLDEFPVSFFLLYLRR